MKSKIILAALFALFVFYACNKAEMGSDPSKYSSEPQLPVTPYHYDNAWMDDNQIALGRVLFYDQKMSLNNSVSCGSCHQQSKAFCDGKQFSTGLQGLKTRRNSPAIVAHDADLFWDGRAHNFHDLVAMPLANHVEMMNYDLSKLEAKVSGISYYPELFKKAFGSTEVSMEKIQLAISSFLQNFNFSNNKYRHVQQQQAAFTSQEQLGRDLFMGKARCGNCHAGPSFAGWPGSEGECIGLDEAYQDNGVGEIRGGPANNAKFRVPTLLNIEFTAPYMHDGRFKTMEEVIEHYNSGIKAHPNLSWSLQDFSQFDGMTTGQILSQFDTNHDGDLSINEFPVAPPVHLNLSATEKSALIAFLKTLSDPNVYTDVRFSDPFVIK